jgi:hypothetical protein
LLKRQERKREGESWEAGERKVRARAAAAGGGREREFRTRSSTGKIDRGGEEREGEIWALTQRIRRGGGLPLPFRERKEEGVEREREEHGSDTDVLSEISRVL